MLALPVPLTDAEIDARFRETMRAAGLGDAPEREAYIRILVTRGIGELTYDPAATPDAVDRRHRQAARRPAAGGLRARRRGRRSSASSATTRAR